MLAHLVNGSDPESAMKMASHHDTPPNPLRKQKRRPFPGVGGAEQCIGWNPLPPMIALPVGHSLTWETCGQATFTIRFE
jgi:hypothetical protein